MGEDKSDLKTPIPTCVAPNKVMFSRCLILSSFVEILRLLAKMTLLNWVSANFQGSFLGLEKYLIFLHEGGEIKCASFQVWDGIFFPLLPQL